VREVTYATAIREAHAELLRSDDRVFVFGQGLWSPWYAGTSLMDLNKEFGCDRVLDSPISENAVTGVAIGAAIAGMRPIVFHPRMDFMLLAFDPIVNQAANWSYMFDGKANAPVVVRSTINRGGEQGAQHSQALHAMLMHVPGLKVVMPSTPFDAKGLLISAVYDGNPVMYIDDRWLYEVKGAVPDEAYDVPIGRGVLRRSGADVTIIGISYMAHLSLLAAEQLSEKGIQAEVVDLRSLKPWDEELVTQSVCRTGRAVVADPGWRTCGAAAEIAASISELCFSELKAPIRRVTLPDLPAPASRMLEAAYYPSVETIVKAVQTVVG